MKIEAARMAGRCRSGYDKGGTITHALDTEKSWIKSLCGKEPKSFWVTEECCENEINCPKCLKKMEASKNV